MFSRSHPCRTRYCGFQTFPPTPGGRGGGFGCELNSRNPCSLILLTDVKMRLLFCLFLVFVLLQHSHLLQFGGGHRPQ